MYKLKIGFNTTVTSLENAKLYLCKAIQASTKILSLNRVNASFGLFLIQPNGSVLISSSVNIFPSNSKFAKSDTTGSALRLLIAITLPSLR